jgi:uncharacterized pyridoxamine 5'-phosphate oxidase family protein
MAKIIFDEEHEKRIKQELIAVSMNNYGLLKTETRHLPSIIHEDEHIGGVIYGRAESAGGMLVATDRRLLFLDHRLFFKKTDEISYDVVSGVSTNNQGNFTSITVHTRLGDFTLRYVNTKSASHFVHYIENIQVERDKKDTPAKPPAQKTSLDDNFALSQDARIFLSSHDIGVVSTIDQNGNVQGAAVYYAIGTDDQIFFVTKNETHKAQNILTYHQVALTIYDATTMQTLQLSGNATVETNESVTNNITQKILRPRLAGKHATVPPILHISAGDYVVIHIKPHSYKFHDYKTW